MTHLAQCPACHSQYQVEGTDVGSTVECDCGAVLFACAASGFPRVPVFCANCGKYEEVDPHDIGRSMPCECGYVVTVPDIVLRLSITAGKSLTEVSIDDDASLACPQCGIEYEVTAQDVGAKAECDCGCIFEVRADSSGCIVANPVDRPMIVLAAEDPGSSAPRHAIDSKKRVPWLSVFSFASVAVFLLTSIAIFLMREKSDPPDGAERPDPGDVAIAAVEPARSAPAVIGTTVNETQSVAKSNSLADNAAEVVADDSRRNGVRTRRPTPPKSASRANSRATAAAIGASTAADQRPNKLPALSAARPFVPIIEPRPVGYTFDRAFGEAFQAFERTTNLKKEAERSQDAADIAAYHTQLGKTLGLMHQAHEIGMRSGKSANMDELRYLMAFLHFSAGHLAEAAIFGEAVIRWGDVSQPATREAAMIALAAMQEANAIGWGQRENVAELRQMQVIAELMAKRMPAETQLDSIWMSLAQLYDLFGYPQEAGTAFARVPKSSQHYAAAQIASGQLLWSQFLSRSADSTDHDQADKTLRNARRLMANGVNVMQTKSKQTTQSLLSAKLSLARMAMRAGESKDALRWIDQPPTPLLKSMTLSKQDVTKQRILVTPEFFRLGCETLVELRSQTKDWTGAAADIRVLADSFGWQSDIDAMLLSVAKRFIAELTSGDRVDSAQVDQLAEMLRPLTERESALTCSNVLWIGESWCQIAELASKRELKSRCYDRAAAEYERAMSRSDFPADSRQSGWLRRSELLRQAGRLSDAIEMMEQVLAESPNAFGLQIEAAYAIEEQGISEDNPLALESAIQGPLDSSGRSTGSAIWGWGKLVSTLYNIRYSDSASAHSKEQFLESQYNLIRCQYLIAKATAVDELRETKRQDVSRQLERALKTTSSESEPWYSKLQQLDVEISGL